MSKYWWFTAAVSERGNDAPRKGTPGIVEMAVDVALAGKPIATYVAGAYAWRLSLCPWLFVGCALIDQPRRGSVAHKWLKLIGKGTPMLFRV
jgi:hypothetical protein